MLENNIEYDGISKEVLSFKYKERKVFTDVVSFEELGITEEILILKVTFKNNIIKLDKVLNEIESDLFIFHLKTTIYVEYILKDNTSSFNVIEKDWIHSYLVDINNKDNDSILLSGNVDIVDGFVMNYTKENLYIAINFELTLGGASL